MSDPRMARREVTTRRPHPCAWCPDEIPPGTVAATWTWPPFALGHGYAHLVCEQIAVEEVAEAFGDDDDLLSTPDREGTLRTLSFMASIEDVRDIMCRDHADELGRLAALWTHPTVQGWRARAATGGGDG